MNYYNVMYFVISQVFTVVSWVSAHGHFNITHDFSLHGCLPGILIVCICIEAV